MEEAIASMPPDAFKIFLYHYPDLIKNAAVQNVDLYCAGHTHGGQVALPLYGAIITFSKFGKQYEAGLYREGATWLYVNRGVGLEGGSAPRVRFWARPELTIIESVPNKNLECGDLSPLNVAGHHFGWKRSVVMLSPWQRTLKR